MAVSEYGHPQSRNLIVELTPAALSFDLSASYQTVELQEPESPVWSSPGDGHPNLRVFASTGCQMTPIYFSEASLTTISIVIEMSIMKSDQVRSFSDMIVMDSGHSMLKVGSSHWNPCACAAAKTTFRDPPLCRMGHYSASTIFPPQSIKHFLCSMFAAHERLVRPDVGPVTVSPAIRHSYVIQISMNSLQSGGAIQIKNNVCIGREHGMLEEYIIIFTQDPAAL